MKLAYFVNHELDFSSHDKKSVYDSIRLVFSKISTYNENQREYMRTTFTRLLYTVYTQFFGSKPNNELTSTVLRLARDRIQKETTTALYKEKEDEVTENIIDINSTCRKDSTTRKYKDR
jgi:hypothetical protein